MRVVLSDAAGNTVEIMNPKFLGDTAEMVGAAVHAWREVGFPVGVTAQVQRAADMLAEIKTHLDDDPAPTMPPVLTMPSADDTPTGIIARMTDDDWIELDDAGRP